MLAALRALVLVAPVVSRLDSSRAFCPRRFGVLDLPLESETSMNCSSSPRAEQRAGLLSLAAWASLAEQLARRVAVRPRLRVC